MVSKLLIEFFVAYFIFEKDCPASLWKIHLVENIDDVFHLKPRDVICSISMFSLLNNIHIQKLWAQKFFVYVKLYVDFRKNIQ